MSEHCAYALPFGAEFIAKGRARFRFWAPDHQAVMLEIEGQQPRAMKADADGWFDVEAECEAGAAYRYRLVANDLAVPDPAARLQAADIPSGASVVVDPRTYAWRNARWEGRPWIEAVLYECHVGALGGFRGVVDYLPHLASIGITAIELMPIADFPGHRNWGYDGALPYAPDTAYGTPEDLKALIDAAHDYGLMIFLDVVYNHFGTV
jgi:maltooligosyltrehalose trehalohydrolase